MWLKANPLFFFIRQPTASIQTIAAQVFRGPAPLSRGKICSPRDSEQVRPRAARIPGLRAMRAAGGVGATAQGDLLERWRDSGAVNRCLFLPALPGERGVDCSLLSRVGLGSEWLVGGERSRGRTLPLLRSRNIVGDEEERSGSCARQVRSHSQ